MKYNQSSAEESEMHFVRLLDDQTFEFMSTYRLDTFEQGCSILSCSFSDDGNVYYCVGTACMLLEEKDRTKVRCIMHEANLLFVLQICKILNVLL